jgi:hypothetical protein
MTDGVDWVLLTETMDRERAIGTTETNLPVA